MRFERLRLFGFKSFVEPAELAISDGLTGVVGPNGCGKSNLLEALRWAMGETSPKSLRGGAMDEVIFAGTATRPARDIAEVTIHLTREGEDAQVLRRLRRGEGSSWRLNGRETRARDVALLFADAATGAHSPAMVGQGRVAALIAARPDERRALLEEAAGSSGLHARRREAEQKLREAQANLARVADLTAGAQAHAATLRRQARAAARYRALSEEMAIQEAAALRLRWEAAEAALRAAEAALDTADAKACAAATDAERSRAATIAAGASLGGARALAAEATERVQTAAVACAKASANLSAARAKAADAARGLASMRSEQAREAARLLDARTVLVQLAADLQAAEAAQAAALAEIPASEAAEASAVDRQATAERELAEAIQTHAELLADHRSARAARDASAAREADLARELARLDREAAALPKVNLVALEEAAHSVRQAEGEVAASAAAVATAEVARIQADAARPAVERALLVAQAEVSGLRAEDAALTRLLSISTAGRQIEIRAEAGFESAVAAALGDDAGASLTTGARYWVGLDRQPHDPELPQGASPIGPHLTAPSQLSRALGQVGIVDSAPVIAEIAALHAGQRLVHRDGRSWRWDGLATKPGGASEAVAEAMRQHNRRTEIARSLVPVEQRLEVLKEEAARARSVCATAGATETAARARRSEAERGRDEARARCGFLEAEASRATAQRDALQTARDRLVASCEAASGAAVAAAGTLAALSDLSGAAIVLGDARTRAERARAGLADARASCATLRQARTDTGKRIAQLKHELEGWRGREKAAEAAAELLATQVEAEQARVTDLAETPMEVAKTVAELESRLDGARAAAAEAKALVAQADLALEQAAADAATAVARASAAQTQASGDAVRRDAACEALRRTVSECVDRLGKGPEILPPVQADAAAVAARLAVISGYRERLGAVNLLAQHELAEIEAVIADRARETTDMEDAIQRLRASIVALNREGRARLEAAHAEVDAHFQALFGTLFVGGQARLLLLDSEDPLDAGLEILAQPPGKRLQSLGLLSGGEQALTALALIFALFLANPAPICVLDEVDAALDDANVERLCAMLDHMVAHSGTRFLIVSHHPLTIARMHRLYGVTMTEPGVSRLVSVDLDEAHRLAA